MATVPGDVRLARHVADISDAGHHTSSSADTLILQLTNKSGGSVAAGDVVVIDTANDTAFTTTTTGQAEISVGVAQATIASNATGSVLVAGLAALVNVPASMTRGRFVETHTVVKQATGSATRRAGSFGQFVTGGTTPAAWLWGQTDQTASGGGGSLTVEEVDTSPTDSAVTKIVFPNGTLAIASHVATYTPTIAGGSGVSVPTLLMGTSTAGLNTQNPAVTVVACASGSTILVGLNNVGRGATSITLTNCTFTKMAGIQNGAGSFYEIWAGVSTGTTGTTLTVNTASSNFTSICVLGVSGVTVTPTAGTATTGSVVGQIATPVTRTAGRFVADPIGADNTVNPMFLVPTVPGHLTMNPASGGGTALWCGFAPSSGTFGGSLISGPSSTAFVVAVDMT